MLGTEVLGIKRANAPINTARSDVATVVSAAPSGVVRSAQFPSLRWLITTRLMSTSRTIWSSGYKLTVARGTVPFGVTAVLTTLSFTLHLFWHTDFTYIVVEPFPWLVSFRDFGC
jgi:hypothetical protein